MTASPTTSGTSMSAPTNYAVAADHLQIPRDQPRREDGPLSDPDACRYASASRDDMGPDGATFLARGVEASVISSSSRHQGWRVQMMRKIVGLRKQMPTRARSVLRFFSFST